MPLEKMSHGGLRFGSASPGHLVRRAASRSCCSRSVISMQRVAVKAVGGPPISIMVKFKLRAFQNAIERKVRSWGTAASLQIP
jgi:hypothetical protein